MRLENLVVGLIIFILVIVSGYNLIVDQAVKYGVDTDTSGLLNITRHDNTEAIHDSIYNKTANQEISDATEADLYRSSRSSSLEALDGEASAGRIIMQLAKDKSYLIDTSVANAAIRIIGVLALAFIIYLGWRFKPQND